MTETVGGRYALDGRLGEGGMGAVYKARHLQLGKPFALKIISSAFALNAVARERFNQEAKLASEITHPNIVSVVDYGEDPTHGAYMVMELVEGEPLRIEPGVPLSIRRACDILGQVADALDHIHKRGIVHGDIKADNIMLTPETQGARRRHQVRLLDFGLARRHGVHAEREQHISGSPLYLAPERVQGEPPSVAGDIYALGVLGYMMLVGHMPFDTEGPIVGVLMAHVNDPVPPMSRWRTKEPIDPALEALVQRALAKAPRQRQASAGAFRYELNTVMDMLELRKKSAPERVRASAPIEVPRDPRHEAMATAFEHSHLAQAICALDGTVVVANGAFMSLLGSDGPRLAKHAVWQTALGGALFGLDHAFQLARSTGTPQEKHARLARPGAVLELTAWISPLSIQGQEIHLLIRVEQL